MSYLALTGRIEIFKENPFPVHQISFYNWTEEMEEDYGDHQDDYFTFGYDIDLDTLQDKEVIPPPKGVMVEISQVRSGFFEFVDGEAYHHEVNSWGSTDRFYFNSDGEEVDPCE